jgi:ABC-type multidrug transport system ATPase subunit
MLCGIYAPDKGNAYILGKSIKTQMNQIRSSLGFCPQHVNKNTAYKFYFINALISSQKGYFV